MQDSKFHQLTSVAWVVNKSIYYDQHTSKYDKMISNTSGYMQYDNNWKPTIIITEINNINHYEWNENDRNGTKVHASTTNLEQWSISLYDI